MTAYAPPPPPLGPPPVAPKKSHRVRNLILIGVIVLIAIAAVSAGSPKSPTPATTSGVQWSDYAPGLQSRIDGLATQKDCTALQTEFDTADANNQATQTRTGHNNAKLMAYIDDKMRTAGCY